METQINNISNIIFNPTYSIKLEKDAYTIFNYIPELCKLYNETNDKKYGNVVAKMIELLFNSPFKSNFYLTDLL